MTNMNSNTINFDHGQIIVTERTSPNGTLEAHCVLVPSKEAWTKKLFREVIKWSRKHKYTHTKMLMRDGIPYFIAWLSPEHQPQEEIQ